MTMLKDQLQVSPLRGMPTHDDGDTAIVNAQSGETVQLYYDAGGTLTADAGQVAGTSVIGKMTYEGIQNALGDTQATINDTSLSFTSTALTNEVLLPPDKSEGLDSLSFADRFSYLIANKILVNNGDFCVDYLKGVIYGIKASTQSTLTSTAYKYKTHVSTASIAGSVTAKLQDGAGNPIGSVGDALKVSSTPAPPASPDLFVNYGANATLNIKSSDGVVYSLYCHNKNAADRFLQLHNTATVPAPSDVPQLSFRLPGLGELVVGTDFFTDGGVDFSTGIAFAFSTTEAIYTAGAASDQVTKVTFA